MKKERKEGQLILLDRWGVIFAELTDEQAGKILKAMYQYKHKEQVPQFKDNELRLFWLDVKQWIDESNEHYKSVIEKRSKAGRVSSENRKSKQNEQMLTSVQNEQVLTSVDNANPKPNANAKPNANPKPNANAKGNDIDHDHDPTGSNFEKIKRYFENNIGDLRSANELRELKDLSRQYFADYIISCIDFMKYKNGRSVEYLKNVCDSQ